MNNKIKSFHWVEPQPEQVASCVDGFLQQLQQPSLISQKGLDESRCRLMVTLLHGNEPSGLKALWRWLKSGNTPAVNCYYFIGAVEAAQEKPGFSLRHFSHLRDLNRCFDGPFDDVPGSIAAQLIEVMERIRPEAVIDVHNTSGSGPSFAVTFSDSAHHIALTSLFSERLLLTETRLGALMERTSEACPIVTIECGGAIDPESERVAWDGLNRFVGQHQVLIEPQHDWQQEILIDPIRVTLSEEACIAYDEEPCADADLTLPPNIEHLNFGRIQVGTQLGHIRQAGLQCLRAIDGRGVERTEQILEVRDHQLINRVGLKVFMLTTNPIIAKSDCLCYVVIDDEPS